METLLQKAKAVHKNRRAYSTPDKQMIQLALAWARDEIGLVQASQAIFKGKSYGNGKGQGVYIHLARALKEHIKNKRK